MSEEAKTKKKQGPKPGRVVRIDPDVQKLVDSLKKPNESVVACIRRLIGLAPKKGGSKPREFFILPDSGLVAPTLEEARGLAVMTAVKTKKGKKQIEKPIKVRVIE